MNRRDRLKADQEYLEQQEIMFDDFEVELPELANRDKELKKYMKCLETNIDVSKLHFNCIKYLLENNKEMFRYWDSRLREYLSEE